MRPNRADVSGTNSIPATALSVGRRPFSPMGPRVAGSSVGLANLPTVVASDRSHDRAYINDLIAAFTSVQGFFSAQLVPLGSGANGVVTRSTAADVSGTSPRNIQSR